MKRLFLVAIVLFAIGLSQTFSQDVPVDISTGTPIVQVPLWNVTDYDLSTPVSLVYNANGVKLQEDDGWYGLGWFLSVGGNIVRQVRSLPDDYPGVTYPGKGWLYTSASGTGVATQVGAYTLSSDVSSSTCTDEQTDQAKIAAWHTELLDTEADIFYYNFGGQSGSFVFDNSSTPTIRFIPYRDFKVSYTTLTSTNKTITSFSITTNNGVIYTFGQAVSATRKITAGPQSVSYLWRDYELYKDIKTFNKEWKLTKIESPSGAIITLNYS
ncbi:MAG TPA: hypothetical protein VL947_13565, partial [Cytophagales bacterium]|nr:hypothetical protein [Cytophagales bacterium]